MNIYLSTSKSSNQLGNIISNYMELVGFSIYKGNREIDSHYLEIDLSNYNLSLQPPKLGKLIYIISTPEELNWFKGRYRGSNPEKVILIINFEPDNGENGELRKSGINIIQYAPDKISELINKLNHSLGLTGEIWEKIGGIYSNKEIYTLIDILCLSYLDKDPEVYTAITNKGIEVVEELEKVIKGEDELDNELDSLYITTNLKYKIDSYCIRSRRNPIYSEKSLWENIQHLLKTKPANGRISDSGKIYLLAGQIINDLIMEPSESYQYYMKSTELGNTDSYFEKGIYWKNYKGYYDHAELNLKTGIAYHPYNYRLWFNLGLNYIKRGGLESGVDSFNKTRVLIKNLTGNRWKFEEVGGLNITDIDYYIKTLLNLSSIYENLGDIQQSIKYLTDIVWVWDKIGSGDKQGDLEDSKEVGYKDLIDKITNHYIKDMGIDKIYLRICELSGEINDERLYTIYQERLRN